MASITLADIKAAADAKYGPTPIELEDGTVVELVNPLKLSKEDRKVLTSTSERLKDEDADTFEAVAEGLVAAAKTKAAGRRLVKALDGDVTYALEIFSHYTQETQAGEA